MSQSTSATRPTRVRRSVASVCVLGTVLLAGVLPSVVRAQGASATAPSASDAAAAPWIVYQGQVGNRVDLVFIHPDGTGATTIPGGPGNRWHPDWSPDGRTIAYDTNRPADDVAEIGVMGVDGSDEHLLLRCIETCYGNGGPAWSPDGTMIAYDAAEGPTAEHTGDLCYVGLFDLVTNAARRILEHPDCLPGDSYVRWSPDGSHLVFQREDGQGMALFSAAIDGTDERQLTDWGVGGRPDWSPDGGSIVYMDENDCDCPRQTVGLNVMASDGTGKRRLTPRSDGIADLHPRWLPDGSAIIFSRCAGFDCEVRLVAPDGSDDRALPVRDTGLAHPIWQPQVPPED